MYRDNSLRWSLVGMKVRLAENQRSRQMLTKMGKSSGSSNGRRIGEELKEKFTSV